MKLKFFTCGLAACLLSGVVEAGAHFNNANPIDAYLANKEDYRDYLNGVMNGVSWANVFSTTLNKAPLYCPPENLAPSDIDYIGLLDQHLENKTNRENDKYIELSLVAVLIDKFPCKK